MRLYHHQISDDIIERVGNMMIRRLVKQWQATKPVGTAMPQVATFSAEALAWCWDSIMLLQQLSDGDLRYLHFGDAIAEVAGFNLKGKRASHLRNEIGEFFRAKYNHCLSIRQPLYTIHRADLAPKAQSWERLLLPLQDERQGLYLLVFNQPLEFKYDLLDSILRASVDGIAHFQAIRGGGGDIVDFLITVTNPAAERIVGLPEAKLVNYRLSQLPNSNFMHAVAPVCCQVLDVGRSVTVELADPRPGRYAVFKVNAVRTGDGATVTLTNISSHKRQEQELRDALKALEVEVAERKQLQEGLTRLASTDALTNLLNRRELLERSKREIATARRYGRALSLLIVDIDFFKRVNDQYGHAVGDVAIRTVADICREALRESDLVARIGGEEYVIVMPETSGERASVTAERLRKAVAAAEIASDDGKFSITASFGVTEWSPADRSIETTLARADSALYEAKRDGRNRVVLRHRQELGAEAQGESDRAALAAQQAVAVSSIRH